MKILAIAILASAIPMLAQTPTPKPALPPVAKVAPVISIELKAAFFKAESQAQSAQSDLEKIPQYQETLVKGKLLSTTVDRIREACGTDFELQLDATGDPVCVVKPEPTKVEEKK